MPYPVEFTKRVHKLFYLLVPLTSEMFTWNCRGNVSKILVDPAQSDAPALAFNFQDFHVDNIPDLKNSARRDLRAMEQAILFDADVDEGTEIHHIAHRPFQLHAGHEVFGFEHIGAQDGQGGICAWIPSRADQVVREYL